jgi:hypothetical protein
MMPRGYMQATLKTTLVAEGSPSPPLPKQTEQRGVTHTISFVTRSLVTKLPQRVPQGKLPQRVPQGKLPQRLLLL